MILYEPFHAKFDERYPYEASTLKLLKISSPSFIRSAVSWSQEETQHKEDSQSCGLRAIPYIGGYSTVFVPGEFPCFLIKTAASSPKMLRIRERGIVGASGFHTKSCEKGWVYFNDEVCLDQIQIAYRVQADALLLSGGCTIISISSECRISRTWLASKETQFRRRSASTKLSCADGNLCSRSN